MTGLRLAARVDERDVEVALDVADGEVVALLGPNGAGKSTVLDLVAGLLRPDEGEVVLDGTRLAGPGAWVPPHRRRTALLAQQPLLFPHLDARDNVAFGPRAAGAPRRTARLAAEGWLERVGLADLGRRRPAELSGGQAQRVAVARALAADPRLLLLDEPLAALDAGTAPALRQLLREVLRDPAAPRTALVVTHDVLDALLLADRVVVLEAGRVAEDGAAADVLSRPRSAFAARIAGLDAVRGTFRPAGDGAGAVVDTTGRTVVGTLDGPAPAAGAAAVAVWRPSAVAVHPGDRPPPAGSPRTVLDVVVTELEPLGDRVRVRAGDLAADVTAAAVAELGLAPGAAVRFAVKATEVAVHPV